MSDMDRELKPSVRIYYLDAHSPICLCHLRIHLYLFTCSPSIREHGFKHDFVMPMAMLMTATERGDSLTLIFYFYFLFFTLLSCFVFWFRADGLSCYYCVGNDRFSNDRQPDNPTTKQSGIGSWNRHHGESKNKDKERTHLIR